MSYFEEEHDEILDLIRNYCQLNLDDTIKSIKWEIVGNLPLRSIKNTNEYDNMSAEDYLVIYKINRLESLGIISEEKSIYLKELLEKKEILTDEFYKIVDILDVIHENDMKDTIKIFKEKVRKIGEEIDEINEELMRYHLFNITNQLLDFKGIIDNMISNEIYPEKEMTK